VTLFGLFLTPVFYVTLMKLGKRKPRPVLEQQPPAQSLIQGSATPLQS